jgi:hypothetical protein
VQNFPEVFFRYGDFYWPSEKPSAVALNRFVSGCLNLCWTATLFTQHPVPLYIVPSTLSVPSSFFTVCITPEVWQPLSSVELF